MNKEYVFKTAIGVDTYSPDIADELNLKVVRLKNVQPSGNRWVMPRGFNLKQSISGLNAAIRAFPFYNEPLSQISHLYAVSNTKVFVFDFISSSFLPTPLITFLNTDDIPCFVSWLSSAYMSKRGAGLIKLEEESASIVADAPSARYMIIADGHLMLLNTRDSVNSYPIRVQWSDLYAPESFTIGPASEADVFELSPDDGEGTGLSYQRGSTLIYTRSRIWIGRYIQGNIDVLGKYKFEVLYNGVGNLYHGARISVKEVDYFIAKDNIYKLEGFQLSEIGDPIWKFFKDTLTNTNYQKSVVAFNDADANEVFWLYDHVDGYQWSIVYNYKEDKWSDRDPSDVQSMIDLDFPFRGYTPIIDVLTPIEDMGESTIDGDWQYLDFESNKLFGGSNGQIYLQSNPATYLKADGSGYECEAETFEFDFNTLLEIKETDLLKVLFERISGHRINSDMRLLVGTRVSKENTVVWSAPIYLKDQSLDDSVFYFRNAGVGHLVRFKLQWTNSSNWKISEIVKLSFTKLENGDEIDQK